MGYSHFYRVIILKLLIIILLSMAIPWLIFVKQAYVLSLLPLGLLVIACIDIVRFFNKINHWIAFFLLGIENEDTTLKSPPATGNKAIDNVYKATDRLNELFRQIKINISTQEQYFRMIIDQSLTGLFAVNENGRIININPAAKKLTLLQDHHHINLLSNIDSALPDFIMFSGKNKTQQSAVFENQFGQKLLFKLSEIKSQKGIIKLVVVSDITKELDNGEVEAWIKLARTLSHEIMNNIAPITTLSQVISGYFTTNNKRIDVQDLDSKTLTNTVKGLRVIEERSLSLMNFTENYRKFTMLPVPQFSMVNVSQLLENNLMAASTYCGFDNLHLAKSIPENQLFLTDEKLLSQVVLNLLKNACEALVMEKTSNPSLVVSLKQTGNNLIINISNNGPAIPPSLREQIFIPFYTTKSGGSGIGLSLSKQIMLKMNGDIVLSPSKDHLTTFSIVLN